MIFSELHSAYYAVVAELIKTALERPVTRGDIARAVREHAFEESMLYIEPALNGERWQVLTKEGTTPIKHAPSAPPTTLQKRWLKAVLCDPRISLFDFSMPELEGVEPLFTAEDYEVFDRYGDGDPYDDPGYRERFRIVLNAIKDKTPLDIHTVNRKGNVVRIVMLPEKLEYSEKDDKFRVIGSASRYGDIVNLARVVSVSPFSGTYYRRNSPPREKCRVTFELFDRRRALERVLLHFAHLEKQTEKPDDDRYLITLYYDPDDETEMLIRILSFGPMIKVTEPESFVKLIKERLKKQMDCGL